MARLFGKEERKGLRLGSAAFDGQDLIGEGLAMLDGWRRSSGDAHD